MTIDLSKDSTEVLQEVSDYVDKYIFNSGIWDGLDDKQKLKAVYNSHIILGRVLPEIFAEDIVDISDLVTEIIWIIAIDDSVIRSQQGATMVSVGDMTLQFNNSNAGSMIAPGLVSKYGLTTTGVKRRVGKYSVPMEDTSRVGMYKGNKERFRYGW